MTPAAPPPARPLPDTLSDLYFILDPQLGAVKIGFARDVKKRIRQLQTGNAGRLRVLGIIDGGGHLERELHARFAAFRLEGEWFTYKPIRHALREFLKSAAVQPPSDRLDVGATCNPTSILAIEIPRLRRIAESRCGAGGKVPFDRFRRELISSGVSEDVVQRFLNTLAAELAGTKGRPTLARVRRAFTVAGQDL